MHTIIMQSFPGENLLAAVKALREASDGEKGFVECRQLCDDAPSVVYAGNDLYKAVRTVALLRKAGTEVTADEQTESTFHVAKFGDVDQIRFRLLRVIDSVTLSDYVPRATRDEVTEHIRTAIRLLS